MNKQNLWFLTLFSLILVLSIFYLTMPDTKLSALVNKEQEKSNEPVININESEILTALRVESDEETIKEMSSLQEILLNEAASIEEKNNAYEALKDINLNKGKEEELENKINKNFQLKAFVKIKNDQIKVVIATGTHNEELANNIIRSIQEEFDTQMYITVKFQNS